ncbi:alpha/beta hydrolase [Cohnella cholangitidis]|uniref:Lysophospholipase n=1 Tax=Cohnella cholangitidis TaxID=2598458 RepID=A0A7G5BSR6_9BACL|nr:alpha/beta hydrolase [Cohnella cholangitidis]QMV40000.1 lysophospholipase [Cohnella cholangitidis]
MSFSTMEWRCADGTRMHASEWSLEPERKARAVIGIVHGMGEHMGRYSHVAEMLNAEGYAVIGFDQRGHGQTEGKRGHVSGYEGLLEGVDRLIAEGQCKYPGVPFFLLGHSMGGNVTLNYLLRKQPDIAGAIVTGPWLKLAFKPPSLQATIGKIIERIYPKYTNNRPMVADSLTTDPVMIERYLNDPLGHGQITAKFFFSVQGAGLWALKHAKDLKLPLLLMHGEDDKVTSIHASKQFAEQLSGANVTWREWPGFKHELLNERGRQEVFHVIRDWLDVQLKAR